MSRPDLLYPLKQQTNYNLLVLKWKSLSIHACELYRYGVNKVRNYFIVVRWIETPVSSFSKVGFNWKISKKVGLAFSNKRLFDYVRINKHIVERPQIYFFNRRKRITGSNNSRRTIFCLHRKYINISFA